MVCRVTHGMPPATAAATTSDVLIGLAVITALGIGAQWLAWRTRIPSILLLLVFGFAAGYFIPLVDPDDLLGDLLFPIVSLSVGIILFEGGLSLRFDEFRQVGRTVMSLVVAGMFVTWVLAALAAWVLLDLPLDLAILLGAILVVTGPTVIVPLLQHVRVRRPLNTILKWEGIVIDPIGAMVAVLVFEAILAGRFAQATTVALAGVLQTVVAGGLIGLATAGVLTFLLRRFLIPDFLQNAVVLMFVIVAFATANALQEESGLLATPLIGLVLANRRNLSVRHITVFQEDLRVLLLAGLFILLGARVEITHLTALGWGSVAFLAVLILVARPAAVMVATLFAKLDLRDRFFLAALAPRGVVAAAVASLFAIRLVEDGRLEGQRLVPETFFVIVGTVAIYGLAARPVARLLGVEKERNGSLILGAYAWARAMAQELRREGQTVLLVDTNPENIREAQREGLPAAHADVLSEETLDRIDVEGLSRLLAMTSNPDLNSLAAVHFSEVFDRSEVYQLSQRQEEGSQDPPHLRGRDLFGEALTFEQITVRFAAGARISRTRLNDNFTFEDFCRRYGPSAVPLFLITEAGDLVVYTHGSDPGPKPGQTLIALVEPTASRLEPGGFAAD